MINLFFFLIPIVPIYMSMYQNIFKIHDLQPIDIVVKYVPLSFSLLLDLNLLHFSPHTDLALLKIIYITSPKS